MEHYIVVDSDKNRQKIQKHLSKYINVHQPVWIMTSGVIQKMQFNKFKHKVVAYQIKGFILSNNGQGKILKEIGGGRFQSLVVLNLSNNCIKNIQALLKFQAPCLETLYLDRNLLINLRSLRKFVSQRLLYLDISYNYLKDLSGLNQFNCPNIKLLALNSNQGIGVLLPLFKSQMNPQNLFLTKMSLVGPTAKDIYIDTCWRKKLKDGLPRTKI